MKIKRFHANNMRNTIRKVREELGADAVILSNRHVADGVEIIAAIDYDESLLPAQASTSYDDKPDTSESVEAVSQKHQVDADLNKVLANDKVSLQASTRDQ
ncbi:MAG: flagellar biosynthesis protein FlhF, partial [Gammaproteobacteria bacterium]|nr:flagellar biosynthesis protein FlhF [Gammaproteobacteria bacterium]